MVQDQDSCGCWAVGQLKTSRFRNRTRLMQFPTVSLSDNLNLHNVVSLCCRFCSSVRQCMQIRPLGSLIVGLLGQPMDTKKLRDRDHPLAPLRLLPDRVPQNLVLACSLLDSSTLLVCG